MEKKRKLTDTLLYIALILSAAVMLISGSQVVRASEEESDVQVQIIEETLEAGTEKTEASGRLYKVRRPPYDLGDLITREYSALNTGIRR